MSALREFQKIPPPHGIGARCIALVEDEDGYDIFVQAEIIESSYLRVIGLVYWVQWGEGEDAKTQQIRPNQIFIPL